MIVYDACSYPGERELNEDSFDIAQKGDEFLFLLADGLGGHGKGDTASKTAAETAKSLFLGDGAFSLSGCFQKCQDALLAEQVRLNTPNEMKTTMVLLHIAGGNAISGHIGDSRLYLFRNKKLAFRSLDHSVPQALVSRGEIKEKDIRGHDDRNRLLRVMGTEWSSPKYELHPPVTLKPKDCFLLCSDGFWEWIDEKYMVKALKQASGPRQWLSLMCETILANGKNHNMDNYTAVAIWVK